MVTKRMVVSRALLVHWRCQPGCCPKSQYYYKSSSSVHHSPLPPFVEMGYYVHLLWDNWVSQVSSSCRIWFKRMLGAKLYRTLEMETNILKCIHKLIESSCRGFSKICSWQCVLYNLTGRFQINCEFQMLFKSSPCTKHCTSTNEWWWYKLL